MLGLQGFLLALLVLSRPFAWAPTVRGAAVGPPPHLAPHQGC